MFQRTSLSTWQFSYSPLYVSWNAIRSLLFLPLFWLFTRVIHVCFGDKPLLNIVHLAIVILFLFWYFVIQRNPKLKICAEHRYLTIGRDNVERFWFNGKDLTNRYVHNGPRMLPILNTRKKSVRSCQWIWFHLASMLIQLKFDSQPRVFASSVVRDVILGGARSVRLNDHTLIYLLHYSPATFFSFASEYGCKGEVLSNLCVAILIIRVNISCNLFFLLYELAVVFVEWTRYWNPSVLCHYIL